MIERIQLGREARRLTALAAGGAALAVLLGCAPDGSNQENKPPSVTGVSQDRPTIGLTPDMAGFLHNPIACQTGGPRPCAALLRTEPNLSGAIINADPETIHIDWPLESYHGQPGDKVQVICATEGEQLTDYAGNLTSTAWYKVEVPAGKIVNPAVKSQLNGRMAIAGYASVEHFNQTEPAPTIPSC